LAVFEGQVCHNDDPLSQGRLKVVVALMPGAAANWARACVPCSGSGSVDRPGVGEKIRILFGGGDTDSPLWIGWSP
jgi:hypothetical protein